MDLMADAARLRVFCTGCTILWLIACTAGRTMLSVVVRMAGWITRSLRYLGAAWIMVLPLSTTPPQAERPRLTGSTTLSRTALTAGSMTVSLRYPGAALAISPALWMIPGKVPNLEARGWITVSLICSLTYLGRARAISRPLSTMPDQALAPWVMGSTTVFLTMVPPSR